MKNNFNHQIEEIVNAIHVVARRDIFLLKSSTTRRGNKEIQENLREFGLDIDILDVRLLLAYHIYYNYYTWPPDQLANCKRLDASQIPVDDLTYEDATGLRTDYWIDAFWKYAKPENDHEFPTKQVLRKGSQGQWVGNGRYVETSVITSDDDPTLAIHQPTHTFAFGSRTGNYNWIYGQSLPDDDNKGSVRFYFHLSPFWDSAALLVREIQKGFDLYEIPFTFKFLTFAEDYQCRSDTAVLYVARKHLLVTMHLVANIYYLFNHVSGKDLKNNNPEVASVLLPETPQFAYHLGSGVAFAENPENNDSFGMNRCKLLADALMNSDATDSGDRFRNVKKIIETKGFQIDEFYKNPYSPTNYEFFFSIFQSIVIENLKQNRHLLNKRSTRSLSLNGYQRLKIRLSDEVEWFGLAGVYRRKYLIAAVRIAIRLCKEALWYPAFNKPDHCWKCNWLSYQPFKAEKLLKTGYQYNMLPRNGGKRLGSESVANFLHTIYARYYESDVILTTVKHVDISHSELPIQKLGELKWEDDDIRLAWAYLNLPESGEERKAYLDVLMKSQELTQEQLDFINASKLTKEQVERLADFIIERFIDAGRPLGNGYATNDPKTRELFCADDSFGLAGLGRFFLKVYEL